MIKDFVQNPHVKTIIINPDCLCMNYKVQRVIQQLISAVYKKVTVYGCVYVCLKLVSHVVYNIHDNINMFHYFEEVVSNGQRFLKVHRV